MQCSEKLAIRRPHRRGASSIDGTSRQSAFAVFQPECAPRLVRGGRKCRQFLDVARVVLDDYGCVEIRRDLLEAFEGRDRLRAIIVEPRHAVGIVILAEVRGIAGDDQSARLRQLDQLRERFEAGNVTSPSPRFAGGFVDFLLGRPARHPR